MIKRLFALLLALLVLSVSAGGVLAQTYLFQVQKSVANLYINQDGTATIEYTLDFINSGSASPIDFVDIGLPNESYALNSISAEINGQAITDIQKSQYVNPGVALGLGANAIPAGQTGKVHVVIAKVTRMLFPGTGNETEKYASLQFSPNWFGSQYVNGSTDMTMTIILPPGMKPEEPRFYPPKSWPGASDPTSGIDNQGRVYYRWQSPNANSATQYTFGAGFPARLVPAGSIVTAPAINIKPENLFCWGLGLFLVGIFGFSIYAGTVGAKKRKLQYMPPRISIEGNGIKRGLTAVEAAILMETPMDKVMTMILFGILKKNGATVTSRDPLELKAADPLPGGLLEYELNFLAAFKATGKAERRNAMQDMMINLVKSVTEKMKGFSSKETLDYYRDIMTRAWEQVNSSDTPEVKSQKYDEYMGWTMLDNNWDGRTRQTFGVGPVFLPIWWGRYDPAYSSMGGSAVPTSLGAGGTSISLPHLPGSDFAASMVNGVQNFSSNVIGDLTSFTSSITNKTNPVPKTNYTSSGGSGGGHCACACACAGCACACAGGGR